jgi:hypothetical protein
MYVRSKESIECRSQIWRYGKKVCDKLDVCKVKGAHSMQKADMELWKKVYSIRISPNTGS